MVVSTLVKLKLAHILCTTSQVSMGQASLPKQFLDLTLCLLDIYVLKIPQGRVFSITVLCC